MNLSFSKVLTISRKRSNISRREAEAAINVEYFTSSIPWIFKLIMENSSTPDDEAGSLPSIPSTQFARFLLMSRIQ